MSNPLETLWTWVAKAPLPVAIALIFVLGGWVYALEGRVSNQATALTRIEAKLDQVDTNVQTLLHAMLWEQASHKKEK